MPSNVDFDDVQQAESIRLSLARIEKTGKFVKYRLLTIRVLALLGALWFAFDSHHASSLLDVECTVVILVGLIVAVCTERVRSAINANTLAVLQAIEESRSRP